ncbi:MAG: hypothetical protein LBJ15_18445 [Comamonas sp.]|jgi:hypothetical protein|uniref:hypothetical protein n=1 Tax=Comamonas sp. TaxID=34028 RepID=UPI00281E71E7|nr:hypothetical protein [Comamonas sp.]MDR0215957.1 hypothetical protein [Comamonas sp.]
MKLLSALGRSFNNGHDEAPGSHHALSKKKLEALELIEPQISKYLKPLFIKRCQL